MTTNKQPWPEIGARVRMTHFAAGNVLRGDHDQVNLTVTGMVTESPAMGSTYLSVKPDVACADAIKGTIKAVRLGRLDWGYIERLGGTSYLLFDKDDSEAWSLSLDRISASRRVAMCEWVWEVLAEPEPTIEVGDLVRYVPTRPIRADEPYPAAVWKHRSEHDSIVVSVSPTRAPFTLRSLAQRITDDGLTRDLDDWYAEPKDLRLVAKATYRRIG